MDFFFFSLIAYHILRHSLTQFMPHSLLPPLSLSLCTQLSLEYCGGGSVADLIRLSDGPLSEAEIGWIMSQILLGLAYLHGKGHVHGDIKAG